MGVNFSVGMLADLMQHDSEGAKSFKQSLNNINAVLAENDLPEHNEPIELPDLESRAELDGYPYSFLHHLRRVYARCINDPDWVPVVLPEGDDVANDPIVDEESCMFESHLLCHSDCEGFYLPVKFEEIIIDEKDLERIEGGSIGSSYQLHDELISIADKLNIKLVDKQLYDNEVEKIHQQVESETGLWIEKLMWLALFEASRLSIQHNTAICFS